MLLAVRLRQRTPKNYCITLDSLYCVTARTYFTKSALLRSKVDAESSINKTLESKVMLSKGRLELSDMDNADFRPRRAQDDKYGQLLF
jgi:hypothetical protein